MQTIRRGSGDGGHPRSMPGGGPYFQLSETFIPKVEGLATVEVSAHTAEDPIAADFINDWVLYLRNTGLPGCGLTYDVARTPHENTMRFLNANNRRIPSQKSRAIHESRELVIPVDHRRDYELLLELIRNGGDLKPYLSRDILKKDAPTGGMGCSTLGEYSICTSAWGNNSAVVLHDYRYGRVHDPDLAHNEKHLWVDRQLLQIMHGNWLSRFPRAK